MSKSSKQIEHFKMFEEKLKKGAKYTANEAKHEDALLVMGNKRSGKSTVVNVLMGIPLIAEKISQQNSEAVTIKKANVHSRGPTIGDRTISNTSIPERWESSKLPNLGIYDTRGFNLMKGSVDNTVNAYVINSFLKIFKSAKILLVADINDIRGDDIDDFKSLLESVESMFQEKLSKCYSSIVVIFTKVPAILNYDKGAKNFISNLLEGKFLSNSVQISEPLKGFIKYLTENKENIAIFKQVGTHHVNENIGLGILKAIHETAGIPEQILKEVSPSIDESAKRSLFNLLTQLSYRNVFLELLECLAKILEEELSGFKKRKDDALSHDELIKLRKDLTFFETKFSAILNPDICFQENIYMLELIHPELEKLIKDRDFRKRVKDMEFVDEPDLKEGRIFDFALKAELICAKAVVNEFLTWVKVESKETTLNEAEASRSKIREENLRTMQELQTQLPRFADHHKKVTDHFAELGVNTDLNSDADAFMKVFEGTTLALMFI